VCPDDAVDRWVPDVVVLTCEHAGREVPPEYRRRFRGARDVLRTHRGSDIGSLAVGQRMAARVHAPLVFSLTTRLLVDLNRSIGSPQLFSEFTHDMDAADRETILARYYRPFRTTVGRLIEDSVGAGRAVLHLSIHSFADVLNERPRHLDIGLLFDPARASEVAVCEPWRLGIQAQSGDLRVAFNEPYLGVDDGHTTALRKVFPASRYAGIEVELRQGLVESPSEQRAAGELLAATLRPLLAPIEGAPQTGG
jgi:predicted N-formylglutamate amidohydrolase